MTKNFDEFFKKYDNPLQPEDDPFETPTPRLGQQAASPLQAGLKKVEQVGGALLTGAVKGVSSLGQGVMGVFDYLENNQGAYEKLYGVNEDGTTDNAGKFHWDRVGGFLGGAVMAGVNQSQRILQSKNLTELGQNSYTGVDLLKNLPGGAGDFYRNQDSHAAKLATSIAGLAIEVLLDPTSKVAQGAKLATGAATRGAVESGKLTARTADVIGNAAANLTTGNWVGGAVAGGAREAAFRSREKLVTFANRNAEKRIGKAAGTILEWAMGPSALTTNAEMRTVLQKYAALKEDLPKEMLKVANTTATVVSKLPQKQRTEAQKLFGQLASAQTQEAEELALDSLSKLGINRSQAATIGSQYRNANNRLIDIIQTAANDVPALKDVSLEMTQYHVRRSYRLFSDSRVREDWLDYLVKANTTGSWQVKNTHLRNQLMEGLEIGDISVPRLDMQFTDPKAPANVGDVVGGFDTFRPKTGLNKNPGAEKQAQLQLQIMNLDERIRTAGPGRDVSSYVKVKERLTQQVEALDKMTAGLGPVSAATPKIQKLQKQIDMLDNAINTSAEKNIDKLTARRNNLQAMLENEINRSNIVSATNTGNPATRARKTDGPTVDWVSKQNEELARMEERLQTVIDPVRKTQLRNAIEQKRKKIGDAIGVKTDLQSNITVGDVQDLSFASTVANRMGDPAEIASVDNIQRQWISGQLDPRKPTTFTDPSTAITPDVTKSVYNASDVLPSMKTELRESGDIIHVPSVGKIKAEIRQRYMDDLLKYLEEDEVANQTRLVGFKKGENGEVLADFSERQATAKNKTLKDIHERTAQWGKDNNLTDEEIGKLNAAVSNSLTYVPGSREFVSMVREKGQALRDLDPQLQQIIQSEIGLSQVDKSALSDRTLDPVFFDLFGKIDNFSVNAAEQGVAVGEVAASAMMRSEMRKRGLVVTEKELGSNPELNRLGGWVEVSSSFSDDGTKYYAQATNLRSIEAIDRSLGDMNKMQALSHASNLFRRAALVTDPSAHATQFLGNMAMLQMMGMRRMFGNDVSFVKGMTQSFKSIMLSDEGFKDAVDAGVMVTQTILSEQQSAALARSLLNLPKLAEKNGDKHGAMTQLFRIAGDTFNAGRQIVDTGVRRGVNTAANAMATVNPALRNGTDAIDAANLALSPSAMFQLSDQMTRMFAYRASLANKTSDLVKANPFLANFTQDSGTRINWESLMQHAESGTKPGITPELVKELQDSHKVLREEAAALANDVALNYSDVPLAVNYLSKTGVVPFIKFQYKATGRIMQFIDERPYAFSPYYAAQRNFNEGMNPDPDNFEQQRMSLSPTVRDAMVIPTGSTDSMGRQEFVDLSRWIPFGMYASAANGGGQEGGLSMQPSSIVSTPILDLYHSFVNADEEKQPGQSMASFMAQKLAETFGAAGVAPGSRKIETLAKAIEQSMTYVDMDGNVVERDQKTLGEKIITGYAGIPEAIGQKVQQGVDVLAGNETLTTAQGSPKPQTELRPRTTVEQAIGRYAVPGVGFSADQGKTLTEFNKRYDLRIQELTKMRNAVITSAGGNINPDQLKQVERIDAQITQLTNQKAVTSNRLLLGE